MKLTEKKWFKIGWAIFLFTYLFFTLFEHHAVGSCSWTDPQPYIAADMLMGVGGLAAVGALFFPEFCAPAAGLLGGLGAVWHSSLMMLGC